MSAAISRYDRAAPLPAASPLPALERGDGVAEIVFARNGLARLYQRTPCRVLFPTPEPDDIPMAALLTTSGGLAGGDRLSIAVAAEARARAVVATAAAEKVYGSQGAETRVAVTLRAEQSAWLEWLPQESILFDGARLVRSLAFEVAAGARLLAAETLVFGRIARGERFLQGLLHESWRVRRGGRLVWVDTTQLAGDVGAALARPAAFGGADAFATALYVGEDAASLLETARDLAASGTCRSGATVVSGVLVARFRGAAASVRAALMRYVAGLRQRAAGLPPRLPRLWHS
ncbi:MAG TPA: urease accessory protein UreD [Stellaceae bacterium]|nr:urease accessory protein UreD [Stellaceae bacterium]